MPTSYPFATDTGTTIHNHLIGITQQARRTSNYNFIAHTSLTVAYAIFDHRTTPRHGGCSCSTLDTRFENPIRRLLSTVFPQYIGFRIPDRVGQYTSDLLSMCKRDGDRGR